MNYEKLTVERFIANLKEGRYAGLTGSRRAIGKTDWSKKDKETAHAAADKHFSKAGAATKGKAAPKKAKSAAVKKVAKKAAKSAKRAAAAKPASAPKAAASAPPAPKPVREPVTSTSPRPGDDPGAVRQNSAATVIAAFRNSGSLNPLEQKAYDVATASYSVYAQELELRAVATLSPSAPTPTPAAPKAARGRQPAAPRQPRVAAAPAPSESDENPSVASPAVSAKEVIAPPGAPRIAVPPPAPQTIVSPPNGSDALDLETLSPDERAQHERLRRAALASGQPVPPVAS